ncbi:hypothetical protein SDC9_133077 [bioreactor metagenome]|uniref:Uncharacterized protein n=1 Tax=bioreactor metagenome TaxID=1076179 RepID=A0A645D9J0_9ZZZZ
MFQRGLCAGVRLVRAVAQAHQPVARVAQVVAHFLERLRGDGRELLVFGLLQRLPHQHHEGAVEEVAHDGGAVVEIGLGVAHQRAVVRQLQQRVVAKFRVVAEIGQPVFGGIAAECNGRLLIEQAGLADQVEADVGQRDVFLDHRAVAAPLRVALAQHQGVVGQMQQVVGSRAHDYMCPTSSGIS